MRSTHQVMMILTKTMDIGHGIADSALTWIQPHKFIHKHSIDIMIVPVNRDSVTLFS